MKPGTVSPEIIEALRAGDHKAFEVVFLAYFGKIRIFIRELVRCEDDAEELSQELFVRLWENRSTIDPARSFNAYMYTLARNSAFNFLKHQLVENAYAENFIPEEITGNPEETLFAEEIALLIEMAVHKMPEQRRRIYTLSRNEGLSNEEIAKQLNISKKTVENQLSLALKDLRKLISAICLFFIF